MCNYFKNASLFFFLLVLITSCREDISNLLPDLNLTSFKVRLTDNPVEVDEVNIHLKKVVVIGRGDRETIDLSTNSGIYNLLDYQDGLDTVIAAAVLTMDYVKEIRLVLGDSNSVVVRNDTFELKVPSGSSSGLKIKVCIDLREVTDYELLLDFDAAASLHQTGNGRYQLKPVIRPMNADAYCGADDEEDDDEELAYADLPVEIRDYISANFTDFDPEEVYQDTLCDGAEVFYIKGESNDDEYILAFAAEAGYELLQKALAIPVNQLPMPVAETIINNYEQYQFRQAYRIEQADGRIGYRVEIKKGNDKKNVILGSEGVIVCEL